MRDDLDGEIISSWINVLTEFIALLFTANIFWHLYKGDGEVSLIFSVLLIALQLEKIAGRVGK